MTTYKVHVDSEVDPTLTVEADSVQLCGEEYVFTVEAEEVAGVIPRTIVAVVPLRRAIWIKANQESE